MSYWDTPYTSENELVSDFLSKCNDNATALSPLQTIASVPFVRDAARKLKVWSDTSTPDTKVNITCDEVCLLDANSNPLRLIGVSTSVTITVAGAGGLDTGSEAANTWYYLWLIATSAGVVSAVLSTSSTAPTLPSGYLFYSFVSAVRNDNNSNLAHYCQFGRKVFYELNSSTLPPNTTFSGLSSTPTSESLAAYIPTSIVTIVKLSLSGTYAFMRGASSSSAAFYQYQTANGIVDVPFGMTGAAYFFNSSGNADIGVLFYGWEY